MDETKNIRITNFDQTRIFGICADSFEELQSEGRQRFKDDNTFIIRMKTGELLENEADFCKLDETNEMVKFTSCKPRNNLSPTDNKTLQNLEKLMKDLFIIDTFKINELENLLHLDKREFEKNGFEKRFLERVSKLAEKAISWKEFDTDAILIKS